MNQQMVTFSDIKFEQANILYNIGCLHSKLGSMDNRMTPEVCILIKCSCCFEKENPNINKDH